MKIKAYIRKQDAVLAGSNEDETVEKDIDVTLLSDSERKDLARRIDVYGKISGYDEGILDLEHLKKFLANAKERDQKRQQELEDHEAAKKAEREAKIAKFLEDFAARKTRKFVTTERYGDRYISWNIEAPFEYDRYCIHAASVCPEYPAWEKSLAEKNQAAEEAAKRAADEEIAREIAARDEWIAAHGSKRLKLAAQEGIECQAIYRDERLALERPGWRWSADYRGEYSDPRNPTLEALESLELARKVAPDAKLAYWEAEIEHDDEENETWRGYCAVAHFLDREIVFGLPDSLLEE